MAGRAARRQHDGDAIGFACIRACSIVLAPVRVWLQALAIEGDRAVDRNSDDALERSDLALQTCDLLVKTAGRSERWRNQEPRADRFQLHGDSVAREQ